MSLKDKLKKANQKSKASENVSKLKMKTLLDPTDANGWYLLAENLFKLGENESGWKCLTTAKKLGSIESVVKIQNILGQYGEGAEKAQASILGREEA